MRKNEILKRLAEIKDLVTGAEKIENMDALETEARSLQAELAEIEKRDRIAAQLATGGGNPVPKPEVKPTENREAEDPFATIEYRKAFMAYAQRGTPIPVEYRTDAYTSTTEAAAVIPTTILNELVSKITAYGGLFSRVRKLNIRGGVNVPILSLKPTASWITEAAPSDRKKITASTSVSFSYFGLECKVATSLLANAATLASFESAVINLVSEAMAKALDIAIAKGAGTTEPVGFTVDTRVPSGQVITLAPADFVAWDAWKKKVMAKLPVGYRAGGVWVMAAGTFEGYIDGMTDAQGQPIGRVNYGIADGAQERFMGKEVVLVEDDVIAAYDAASTGDVVAAFVNLNDYAINSNLQMQMFRWTDHDLNQVVDKALLIADGKLIDPNGVVLVKKGA